MMSIEDTEIKGKKVLVRVDLNSPMEDGRIMKNPRMHAHAKTIIGLSERGAKIIVISHQGRKGEDDFTHLCHHTELLKEITGKQITFIDDVIGVKAKKAILDMKNNEIIVLDNVRMLDDETKEKGNGQIVTELAPMADYFVLDALSIAHRAHASVVGFIDAMPSFAGPVLAAEINAVDKVKQSSNVTFFFGGSKVEDSFTVMRHWLGEGKINKVLVGGALSVLLAHAAGYNIADSYEFLEEGGLLKYTEECRGILNQFAEKIVLPLDFGMNVNDKRVDVGCGKIHTGQIFDIGEKTIQKYAEILSHADTIVANGPAGVYELEEFSKGTRGVLNAIADSSAFSLLGGGHTITAIEKFRIPKDKFGYVSLSGKALIEYLCGKNLHALTALEDNGKKFFSR